LKVSKDLPGVPLAGFSILVSKMKRTMKIEKQELHYFEEDEKKNFNWLRMQSIDLQNPCTLRSTSSPIFCS